ncbi:FeoC-like transcriptional regulator [Irregularibacter muris]|jgi:predicted transcriptional regulator|uniref:FeoC-like transcriptional regulator n=1 Tax=Irregularibacter muris TaxID=1796619 RepID=A0AAE3HG08_9FIRM|nr:FeoC-like transcriptional regulator [Irregularibacter muris]MCR1898792.1 FeoC-like transcriptional regulator [Irregularibacter muris]
MLKDVLREINELSGFSKSTIAKNLNIPQGMVDDVINQLTRMGYLDEIVGSPSCDTPCHSCPYSRSCNTPPVKMYKISPKGEQLLESTT